MECLPIAELKPELPNLPTKQFKAIITLLWPYSSSTRQCALLLAEPDFRLRRKKGQVRVRFTGASAKAIAESGAGIGDEMIIGLGAVQFVPQETGISTPGKSIDWELSYSHTLDARVRNTNLSTFFAEAYNRHRYHGTESRLHGLNSITPHRHQPRHHQHADSLSPLQFNEPASCQRATNYGRLRHS
jgi:hypothetical protein